MVIKCAAVPSELEPGDDVTTVFELSNLGRDMRFVTYART